MIRGYIIVVFFFSEFISAQDIHYSQFDKTKSIVNPSLIANQKKDYEIQLQRRSQWSSVTVPFNTFSFSFNAKHIYKRFSLGGTILNDMAGDSRFLTNGISLSLVNSFITNENFFAFGFQTALYQRSINYDKLIFLENENITNSSFLFFDFGFGASNYKRINKSSYLLMGASIYHLNKPKQSFLSNDDIFLHPKYIFHLNYSNRFTSTIDILPAVYFSSQNQDNEFIIGSSIKHKLNQSFYLKSGVYTRIEDAVIVTLGFQTLNLEAIISYDINTSSLANASNSMGGLEFSVTYAWNIIKEKKEKKELKAKQCPSYL